MPGRGLRFPARWPEILDRSFGLAFELGDLGEEDGAPPPGRALGGDFRSQYTAGLEVVGRAATGLVEQVGALCEPPEGALLALDRADLGHELQGAGVVGGLQGEIEQGHQNADVGRLQRGELEQVLPSPVRFAEPDLDCGEPIEKDRLVVVANLAAIPRQLRDGGPGRVAALRAPVVQASQLSVQAGPQVFFDPVKDLQGGGALVLALGQPCEVKPNRAVAGVLDQGRGEDGPSVFEPILGCEQVDAQESE